MGTLKVTQTEVSTFGTRGAGNGQFQYPAGSVVANGQLFVVDKQNNRVQVFTLAGVYVSQFGTFGTGNDNFSFPEGICTDGSDLYIVDSGNHRIKKVSFAGTYISQFGSRGTGNDEFQYPVGITYFNSLLIIADKQNNRIKIHDDTGVFLSEFNDTARLNFPEGVVVVDSDTIVVADSGNKLVKYFTLTGSKLFESSTVFEFPTGIADTQGIITISDRQANKLVYLDYNGNFIGSDDFAFNWNTNVAYNNNQLYVVDSGDHEIILFDMLVELDVPTFASRILTLTKQLYPTGRAWWMKLSGIFDKVHDALSYSEARAYDAMGGNLDSILPDNDNFTTEDANRWELALGLQNQPLLSLDERKIIIERKIQYPGTIKARQSAAYMQDELQKVGFDVYVFPNNKENFNNPIGAIYGQVKYGQVKYGQVAGDYTVIANNIEDETFNIGNETALRATFFIGGEILGDRGFIDPLRKDEFRELILKIKPAQSVGFLYIDYEIFVPTIQELFTIEGGIDFSTSTVVDSKSGFDAQLIKTKAFKAQDADGLILGNIIDFNSDFSFFALVKTEDIFTSFSVLSNGWGFNTLSFNFKITSSGTLEFYYNNVLQTTTSSFSLNTWLLVALVRSGNDISFYSDGVLLETITVSGTITSTTTYAVGGGTGSASCRSLCGMIGSSQSVISDENITNFGGDANILTIFLIANKDSSTHIYYAEMSHADSYTVGVAGSLLFDFINGVQGSFSRNTSEVVFTDEIEYFAAQRFGFDLYTLDSDTSITRTILRKTDGSSWGLTFAGWSLSYSVIQDGWSFLDYITKFKQPDEASLKLLDTALFYFDGGGVAKEISFADLQGVLPAYISGDITTNKIGNLKFLI
jgi:hypothetical protein